MCKSPPRPTLNPRNGYGLKKAKDKHTHVLALYQEQLKKTSDLRAQQELDQAEIQKIKLQLEILEADLIQMEALEGASSEKDNELWHQIEATRNSLSQFYNT